MGCMSREIILPTNARPCSMAFRWLCTNPNRACGRIWWVVHLPFWRYFFPRLKKLFPSQLGNVDLKTFYKAINKVEPSLIRVNADEATYNLHIMLQA